MMAKIKTVYVCAACGASQPRWAGQCPACMEWNTFSEEFQEGTAVRSKPAETSLKSRPQKLSEIQSMENVRTPTGIPECDRVLGGGLIQGSLVLIGGQPGIGKSTLLLQLARSLMEKKQGCLYVSGEESEAQVKHRAERMKIAGDGLWIYADGVLEHILQSAQDIKPHVLVLDSIQTVRSLELQSVPGSVAQIRECTFRLMEFAKTTGTIVILVGHITKDGEIAGPRLLEHMVDVVLQFEGDRQHLFRVLRGIKNRFGATDEVGIFEMASEGLLAVENPAAYFLSESQPVSGTTASVITEGSQSFLVEVQSLVSDNHYTYPRRTVLGWDANRLHLLLAVLERRAGMNFGQYDVTVNLAGGIRSTDPGLDLALAMAVGSSLRNQVLPQKTVFLGELGLGGEVRGIARLEQRVREAQKQGFTTIVGPASALSRLELPEIRLIGVRNVREAMDHVREKA